MNLEKHEQAASVALRCDGKISELGITEKALVKGIAFLIAGVLLNLRTKLPRIDVTSVFNILMGS